jgi:hypothetical protein
VGFTVTAVPLVTAPTLLSIEPVPLLNVPVNVVEPPAVIDDEPATKLLIDGAGAAAVVIIKLLEKLEPRPPPVTYSMTLPTFVAGGVQVKFQDVVSPVEKAN